MGLVYLPTIYHKNQPNVGKYTIITWILWVPSFHLPGTIPKNPTKPPMAANLPPTDAPFLGSLPHLTDAVTSQISL